MGTDQEFLDILLKKPLVWSSISSMCAYGAKKVRSGKVDALKFELFNLDEAKEVRKIMSSEYPDVPYIRHWIAGGPDDGS